MPAVTLDRMWLHLAEDYDTFLAFFTTDRSDGRGVPGEVRPYASGRRRIVRRTGGQRSLPVTLRQVSDADLVTLDDWQGESLMVRDHRGRLFYAAFFSIAVTDYKDRSGYDVAVTLVSYTDTAEV